MNAGEIIGSLGVCLLLIAFTLNARGTLHHHDRAYQGLNALGAGLACYASWLIAFMPFVVLEASWCAVACWHLLTRRRVSTS